jgi:hypothetical protein
MDADACSARGVCALQSSSYFVALIVNFDVV